MKKILTLLVVGCMMTPTYAQHMTGEPDSNFNSNGFKFWDAGKAEGLSDVAVDDLGYIWSVGSQYNPDGMILVTRLQPDGQIDPSFGTNGILTINPNANEDESGLGIILLVDGTAVIATVNYASNSDITLYRIMKNGTVDPNWGNGGKMVIDESNSDVFGRLILDSQGRIVLVGTTKGNMDNDILIARIKSNGQIDSSFSVDGVTVVDLGTTNNTGQDLVESPNGGYYVVSTADDNRSYIYSVSSNGNGRLDFNNKSYFSYQFGTDITQLKRILVDSAGNILMGGRVEIAGNRDALLVRVKSNGNVDLSFNASGSATFYPFPANQKDENVIDMKFQDDGKILFITMYGPQEYAIFRVKPDGTKDPFFGNNNGFYKGSPDANINFFSMNAMEFTSVDSQAVIVGNIYLGPVDYLYYHAFYYDTDKPSSGENTGIENSGINSLSVFPNPGCGRFHVSFPNEGTGTIRVYSADGRLVHQTSDTQEMNLDYLANGLYHVIANQGGNQYRTQIQILH
ncbi:MAG: T9SS type A sorting domain-containing protein [Bacteroidetes bacterium]|nr:T9SS type A sorting domain-containing protein [Bacteroidota bacterium]